MVTHIVRYWSQPLLPAKEVTMFTLLMLIACAFIVGGVMMAVLCMEQTLTDNPGDS